jgi:ubiquinone biosynthesis monooxygenase Coq7
MSCVNALYDRIIRVDLAGEKGACAIYAGQTWALALKNKPCPLINSMYTQEVSHVALFEKLRKEYDARPTLFDPLWMVLGWGLGAVTGCASSVSAMTCTTAVEDVIERHYAKQITHLTPDNPLVPLLQRCQADEAHHFHQATSRGGHLDSLLGKAIKCATQIAVWVSERV